MEAEPLDPARLGACLNCFSYRYADEADLQKGIAAALSTICAPTSATAARNWQREYDLGPAGRIDFMVSADLLAAAAPGIGVEIKVGGSLSEVTRQLHRYAEHPSITGLLLVTTRAQHRRLPPVLAGKPIAVLHIGDGAL